MKNQFKPFDQVLVRDFDFAEWYPASYRYYDSSSEYPHICDNFRWKQCIPYNEETAHLIGTSINSEQKTVSKEKKVHVWTSGTFNEWMTEDEFKNFINTAVLNNRDITDFHVLYVR